MGYWLQEHYGKVVIGKAYESLDTADKGKGIFYEVILFDEGLSSEDVESIIKILKTFYDFTPKVKIQKEKVVDQSLLQNLN